MVKRHPDWLHAYIGIGQIVNMMDNERVLYERLLGHAKEQKETKLLAKLEALAPYPDPNHPARSFVEHGNGHFLRRELSRLAGETTNHHEYMDDTVQALILDKVISPHLSLGDISNWIVGDEIALLRPPYHLTKDFLNIDLPNELGDSFDVPIFFFTGAHDWNAPRMLSDRWFDEITAPIKELMHFEESSLGVVGEEPGKFLGALVNRVLPVVG